MSKLFVLTRNDLPMNYQAVQAGHAIAQWMLDNKNQDWNNQTLVYLNVPNEEHLKYWCTKLDYKGISYTSFHEPDIGNQMTSIACHKNDKLFSKLKLMGS